MNLKVALYTDVDRTRPPRERAGWDGRDEREQPPDHVGRREAASSRL
jgi:hypothetical protein